jgi:hypothetical protein
MIHACVQRFDVTENLKNFAKFLGSKRPLTEEYGHWPIGWAKKMTYASTKSTSAYLQHA